MRIGSVGFCFVVAALVVGSESATRAQAVAGPPGAPLLELFQELDTSGDRVITPDEVPAGGKTAFQTLLKHGDADKDGRLTGDEYRDLLQKAGRNRPALANPEEREKRFAKMDTNGDGKLAGDELPENLARIKRLDRDGDGAVSRSEFLAVQPLQAGPDAQGKAAGPQAGRPFAKKGAGPQTGRPFAKKGAGPQAGRPLPKKGAGPQAGPFLMRLKEMDKDGDKRISRSEFTGPPAVFNRLDRNDDGYLDRSDRQAQGRTRPGGKAGQEPETQGKINS